MKRTIRRVALAAALAMALASALPATAQTFEEALAAYERGDYDAAYRGFRSLAEQGDAIAQNNLGAMYDLGAGVPQDYAEAVKWYRRAAEQGDANAQNNLGAMYGTGEGVPQDYAEAVKWYRRAAERGDANAQGNLGFMYANGRGVPQDYVRAHMWSNLAVSRFSATEKERRERAERNRDRAARHLSSAEIARAQRMAREWRPRAEAESASPAPRTAEGGDDTQARVAAVQRALARLGYDPGPADGVLGPKTRVAIRAFQAAAAPKREPARRALERASTGSGFRVKHGRPHPHQQTRRA